MVRYLLDTNSLIYALNGQVKIPLNHYLVSVITEIELLSYSKLTKLEDEMIRAMLNQFEGIALTEKIKNSDYYHLTPQVKCKDPYILEFIGLEQKVKYSENDLETALLDHLQDFLLELGNGFCFEARQKRISIDNEHDKVDLVFYHRILKCHVLIDLKIREFKHSDVGQMNFYVNYYKNEISSQGDNPPIALILCANKNSTKVKYAKAGLDENLFVSKYKISLPSVEEMETFIKDELADFEEQLEHLR